MSEDIYISEGADLYPAGPSVGTAITTSGTANTYGSYVQMVASTAEDIYITGISIRGTKGADTYPSYVQAAIAVGANGSEVIKAVKKVMGSGSANAGAAGYCPVENLRVASGSRIAVKVAHDLSEAVAHPVTLHYVPISKIINPVLAEVENPTFTVQTDAGNSTTQVKSNRTETVDNFWKDPSLVKVTSGALLGQTRKLTGYNGTTKIFTFDAFTGIPADDVTMEIINQ